MNAWYHICKQFLGSADRVEAGIQIMNKISNYAYKGESFNSFVNELNSLFNHANQLGQSIDDANKVTHLIRCLKRYTKLPSELKIVLDNYSLTQPGGNVVPYQQYINTLKTRASNLQAIDSSSEYL